MRKLYLEIESYQDDTSVNGIRMIGQATKNRREKLARNWKNIRLDFFEIDYKTKGKPDAGIITRNRLFICQELSLASIKLMSITSKELYGRK